MKRSTGFSFVNVIITFILMLFVILCIYPFYYMLIYSLSDPTASTQGIAFLPRDFTFANYRKVLNLPEIPRALMVSVARTVLGTATTLACCGIFAYLVTQQKMYFRKLIYRSVIVTMYVSGGLIPTFLVIMGLGLRNNFLVYILPLAMNAFYVILIKTFIEQLPASLEESAQLEGAGVLTRFFFVIAPLSKPIFATIAIFAAVHQWNSWFDAMIYMSRNDLKPLMLILYEYQQETQRLTNRILEEILIGGGEIVLTPDAVRMTVTAVITIPIVLVYPFMQRHFVKGIMIGAIKG